MSAPLRVGARFPSICFANSGKHCYVFAVEKEWQKRKGCRSKPPPFRFMRLARLSCRLEVVADAYAHDVAFTIAVFPFGPNFEQAQIERRIDRQPPYVQSIRSIPTRTANAMMICCTNRNDDARIWSDADQTQYCNKDRSANPR